MQRRDGIDKGKMRSGRGRNKKLEIPSFQKKITSFFTKPENEQLPESDEKRVSDVGVETKTRKIYGASRKSASVEIVSSQDSVAGSEIVNRENGVSENSSSRISNPDMIPVKDNDSDDDLFSRLDIDEIVQSSQDASQGTALNVPKVINLTPVKLPRVRVTRTSPIAIMHSTKSPTKSDLSASTEDRFEQKNSKVSKKLVFLDVDQVVPYYLKNFEAVISTVINEPFNDYLLDAFDQELIQCFRNLSLPAKCLYIRLFQRKWGWKKAADVKYPDITEDLTSVFTELHFRGFLVHISEDANDIDLQSLLSLLNVKEMFDLAKQLNVKGLITKRSCKSALLSLATQNKSLLFGSNVTPESRIRKLALQYAGSNYQVEGTRRGAFIRYFIIYSPPQYWEDEQQPSVSTMLKILQSNKGLVKHVDYALNRKTKLYIDKEDIKRFQDALNLHSILVAHIQDKNWDEVIAVGEESLQNFKATLENNAIKDADSTLPFFLRVYKAGSVLARNIWLSVEGHQKIKNYSNSNVLIETLLSQNVYIPNYRGRWYERFVINQWQLKTSDSEKMKFLERALKDPFLQDSHRLQLSERLDKLASKLAPATRKKSQQMDQVDKDANDVDEPAPKKSKYNDTINKQSDVAALKIKDVTFRLTTEFPTRKISGEKIFNPNLGKSVFLSQQIDGSSNASSVEMFAISYYKSIGYTFGIHAEGAIISTLFGLLFWDEIYLDEVPDTFLSPYQMVPLDLSFDEFFSNREGILVDKLKGMKSSWTMAYALKVMENNWINNFEKFSLVFWELFSNVQQAQSLLLAMGLGVAAAIFERLAKNYRHCRSGFPDLVVWNGQDCCFVEVKGPNDSLSYKQKIWIDYLLKVGGNVEVCLVEDKSNKRIR